MIKNNINFIVLVCFSLLTSCDDSNKNTELSVVSNSELTQSELKSPTKKVYLLEDLNDPEFYKHERLQFVWQPKGEKTVSVWTIKLDGSDLRRVIEAEKMLYNGAARLNSVIKRSPNRRYLAYANDGDSHQVVDKNIIDLKTGKIIKLGTDSSGSVFFWSADGKFLFFVMEFKFHRYSIENKKITTLSKRFRVSELTALSDGDSVIGHYDSGIAYYNYNGKFLKEIEVNGLKKLRGGIRSIAGSGSHLLLLYSNKYYLYKLGEKPELIKSHEFPSVFNSSLFVLHNNVTNFFIAHKWGVMRYELKTDNYYKIYDGDGSRIGNFSILY